MNIKDGPRRLMKVDKHEAVNVGDLEKCSVALRVVEPKSRSCAEAAVREGAEELTLRRGEEGGAAHLPSTTRTRETRDGDHGWWARSGTQCAKPSVKAWRERSG